MYFQDLPYLVTFSEVLSVLNFSKQIAYGNLKKDSLGFREIVLPKFQTMGLSFSCFFSSAYFIDFLSVWTGR